MIRTNRPISILLNHRSGKTLTGVISISILSLTLNVRAKVYEVTILDKLDNHTLSQRVVQLPISVYEQLKAQIISQNSYSETGTELDLKIMPQALLSYVLTDVREDGKLIYSTIPSDWELVPIVIPEVPVAA